MYWKRTGVAVVLVAALILLLMGLLGPFIWAVRMAWHAAIHLTSAREVGQLQHDISKRIFSRME
jgi:hypothetical protein